MLSPIEMGSIVIQQNNTFVGCIMEGNRLTDNKFVAYSKSLLKAKLSRLPAPLFFDNKEVGCVKFIKRGSENKLYVYGVLHESLASSINESCVLIPKFKANKVQCPVCSRVFFHGDANLCPCIKKSYHVILPDVVVESLHIFVKFNKYSIECCSVGDFLERISSEPLHHIQIVDPL